MKIRILNVKLNNNYYFVIYDEEGNEIINKKHPTFTYYFTLEDLKEILTEEQSNQFFNGMSNFDIDIIKYHNWNNLKINKERNVV